MYPIKEFTDVEVVFPTDVKGVMPPWEKIPQEFKDGKSKWCKIANDWFYKGFKNAKWKPKVGLVDAQKALRHVRYVMQSREPHHEHKMAATAYLLSEWFKDVTYETSS